MARNKLIDEPISKLLQGLIEICVVISPDCASARAYRWVIEQKFERQGQARSRGGDESRRQMGGK